MSKKPAEPDTVNELEALRYMISDFTLDLKGKAVPVLKAQCEDDMKTFEGQANEAIEMIVAKFQKNNVALPPEQLKAGCHELKKRMEMIKDGIFDSYRNVTVKIDEDEEVEFVNRVKKAKKAKRTAKIMENQMKQPKRTKTERVFNSYNLKIIEGIKKELEFLRESQKDEQISLPSDYYEPIKINFNEEVYTSQQMSSKTAIRISQNIIENDKMLDRKYAQIRKKALEMNDYMLGVKNNVGVLMNYETALPSDSYDPEFDDMIKRERELEERKNDREQRDSDSSSEDQDIQANVARIPNTQKL